MKQSLLLMVLAFVMCSINTSAQEKEYKVEDDGFEWYETSKYSDGHFYYGAQDKFGNTLVPMSFEYISYDIGIFRVKKEGKSGAYDTQGIMIIPTEYDGIINSRYGVLVRKNGYRGVYNTYGKCLIPVSRCYKEIFPYGNFWECHYSEYGMKGKCSICDASGRVIFNSHVECDGVWLQYDSLKQKYAIIRDRKYFVDKDDNIVYDPQCYEISHGFEGIDNIWIKKVENGTSRNLTQTEKDKVIFSGDILSGNKDYYASLKKKEGHLNSTSNPSSSASNTNNSINNNSGNKTTTVVVEPVPVQEWQACFGCGGMGTMGCDGCGGSGTKYIGDRLHRCSRCNGQGIIPCNVCYGNKGKYVTVYR